MAFISTKLRAFAFSMALVPVLGVAAEESAQAIMEKVDHATRKSFDTQLAFVKITTCKYTVVKGSVQCTERPREVVAENTKKVRIENGLFYDNSLSIQRDPISDRGTSLLVYEYGERGRANDNWIYLPALGKINRVIANDDEAGSVFGSEFSVESTENPEARKVYEYTYKILDEVKQDGRDAWVIELLPTPEKARTTSYTKVVAWIDKKTYLTLKEDLYRGAKVHKQRTQSGIKEVDGVYVTTIAIMNNLTTSRISQMAKLSMRHNIPVNDEFLTQRALTDFSFRERNLAQFRAALNVEPASQ
ncbi:outer membrane lipoprotein-sorting protein [Bordetella tumulicola]|uniref:outer membrane lipoprotein-sorting protein n=1 Tax=Bordetella tumulicola TaxID=1649133 RepID=UPI0039F0DDED